jgi:hypothetical protein
MRFVKYATQIPFWPSPIRVEAPALGLYWRFHGRQVRES